VLIYAIPTDPIAAVDELAALYARVFAEPPYWEGPEQVREFVTSYTQDTAKPGFAVVTAHEDETLVGFAYGAARPPAGGGADATPHHRPRSTTIRASRSMNGPSTSSIGAAASAGNS
jgi:hypothetical protein